MPRALVLSHDFCSSWEVKGHHATEEELDRAVAALLDRWGPIGSRGKSELKCLLVWSSLVWLWFVF